MSRRRVGFTTRASCLLAAGATAVLCGVVLGETDLLRAGLFALAVPLVAAVVVHRARLRIANRRTVEPRRVTAGDAVTVTLAITNKSVLPSGALMLEDELPDRVSGRARFTLDSLSSRESRTVAYRLPALGRGRYRVGPLRIRLADPFRMLDLSRAFTTTAEFVVTPVIDDLPPAEPPRSDDVGGSAGSHSVGAHGADDASTREYRTGDDLRKIHWRSSARTGNLMVRQEERPWRAVSTVVLDLRAAAHVDAGDAGPGGDPGDTGDTRDTAEPAGTAGTGDAGGGAATGDPRWTSSLEWAVSAAASIGAQALRAGRTVGLVDGPTQQARLHLGDVDQLATHLALVRETRSADLVPMSELIRAAARDSALIAVLGRLSPTDLRLLADAHPRGRVSPALALLLDVDSWRRGVDPVAGTTPSTANASAAVLRSAGWRVQVVQHGMPIAQAWQLLLAARGGAGARSVTATARAAATVRSPR